MTVVVDQRTDFTLDNYEAVAWRGDAVAIASRARTRMHHAYEHFRALVDVSPDLFVYGITHAGGEQVRTRITAEQRAAIRHAPDYGSSLTFGRPLPERVVRGIVFARLANYVEGNSAVRPAVADAVAAMLDGRPLPVVPLDGNGGAGEILALGALFGEVGVDTGLDPKERGALTNGSPCAAALVSDAAVAGRRRLRVAEAVLALSVEAFLAPLDAYKPELEALWIDPHESVALRTLRQHLDGGSPHRRAFHAPVSYRILPRVLGQVRRAVEAAEHAATTSLASVTDNPVFVGPDAEHPHGQVFSNGGYHNAMAYPALDTLAAAWADLAQLAERHVVGILNEPDAWKPAPAGADAHHSLMVLPMACVGQSERARRAAQRVFLPPSSGGLAQDDIAVPTFVAWDGERVAAQAFTANLSMLACVAVHALRESGRPAPPALIRLSERLVALFPPVDETRPLNHAFERVADLFEADVFGAGESASCLR